MSYLWHNQNNFHIEIPTTEEILNITFYIIKIKIAEIKWEVKRRYSEFFELHEKLIMENGISKDILPSKKIIGNKSDAFINSRRKALQSYLQKIFILLKVTMPQVFVEFLNIHLYDVFFLLKQLSQKCFSESDYILSTSKMFTFTPLELYAINEFLRNPIIITSSSENILDLAPILDLCVQLNTLTISGNNNKYLHSNIVINQLPIGFSPLKVYKNLYLKNISLHMIYSLGTLRDTLKCLQVSYTNAKCVAEILQCDVLHKNVVEGSEKWTALEVLDLSNNNLTEIDPTINLARKLKTLILNDNKISTISDLTNLPELESLSICNNLITNCDNLHRKLGNIKVINLSHNNIATTEGFCKLYSVESLNLSNNKIVEFDMLKYLDGLPCLENLVLIGNSVSKKTDYRIKVLEIFGYRAKDIHLDNENPHQTELDKIDVMKALKIVKEGGTPDLAVVVNSKNKRNF